MTTQTAATDSAAPMEKQLSFEEWDRMIREFRQTHGHLLTKLTVDGFLAEKRREALAE